MKSNTIPLTIVADTDIPYLKGVLERFVKKVVYLKGSEISPKEVRDADVLIVRTRTKCRKALLEGAKVKFVASATIGTDHIDTEYLKSRGIGFVNASGCNAGGVMQYVFTALYAVAMRKGISLDNKTIGVVGVGNTGGRVAAFGEYMGFNVLRNDPPLAALCGDNSPYCSLEYLLENSDIVTMHVPLDDTTRSMASPRFFSKMRRGAIFINASRGEVVQDNALLDASLAKLSALILDVWNGEPSSISQELLARADIATPHIAGYSLEGKINATAMVVQGIAKHFSIPELEQFFPEHTPTPTIDFTPLNSQNEIARVLLELFPVMELDSLLRSSPAEFEKIRSQYRYRREFKWKQ